MHDKWYYKNTISMNEPNGSFHTKSERLFKVGSFRIHRFIIGFLLTSVTGFGLVPFLPKYYESSATLVLRAPDQNGKLTILKQDLDEKAIQSEIDILSSLPMTSEVINRLKLEADPEFKSSPKAFPFNIIQTWFFVSNDQDAAHVALSHLTIQHDRRSYTIRLGYQTKSPEKSAQMAQTLANIYLENLTERKQKILSRDVDMARSKLLSASFRNSQITASLNEIGSLASAADLKEAIADLISEKVRIAQTIDLARSQIAEAEAHEQNAEPDAELIAPARPQSIPAYPNQIFLSLAILMSASLLGTFTALKNVKNIAGLNWK